MNNLVVMHRNRFTLTLVAHEPSYEVTALTPFRGRVIVTEKVMYWDVLQITTTFLVAFQPLAIMVCFILRRNLKRSTETLSKPSKIDPKLLFANIK